jgi:biotin carboxyl carrier protein
MKMEIPVVAPRAGKLARFLVAEGEAVAEGQVVAEIE